MLFRSWAGFLALLGLGGEGGRLEGREGDQKGVSKQIHVVGFVGFTNMMDADGMPDLLSNAGIYWRCVSYFFHKGIEMSYLRETFVP